MKILAVADADKRKEALEIMKQRLMEAAENMNDAYLTKSEDPEALIWLN